MVPAWLTMGAAADLGAEIWAHAFGLPVRKQVAGVNPLTATGFEQMLRPLLTEMLTIAGRGDKAALKRILAIVDTNWAGLSPIDREMRIRQMARALRGVPDIVVPQIDRVLALQGPQIVSGTKVSTGDVYSLSVRGSFNVLDQRVVDAARRSQAHYIRNEYGRREERASEVAREIVASGLEKGFDRYAIAEDLEEAMTAIGVQRSRGYYGLIASVFAGRARTWGQIAAFEEAAIEHMEWLSMLDERTSDVCRYLDGKTFPVAAAKHRYEEVAASPDPEAVAELQPWVSAGKTDDGSTALFYKQGGKKHRVAKVERSGLGVKDDRGDFSGGASVDALVKAGITSPPAHAHCRSLLVPASGTGSTVQVPVQVSPPDPPAAVKPKKPKKPGRPKAPAPVEAPAPAPHATPVGVFEPTAQIRRIPDGGVEFIDASGNPIVADAVTQRAMALLGASVGRQGVSLTALANGSPDVDADEPFQQAIAKIGGARAVQREAVRASLSWNDLERLTYPSSRLDDTRAARFVAALPTRAPVLVKYGGRYYVRDPELVLASRLHREAAGGSLGRLDVDLLDLDKLAPPAPRPVPEWASDAAATADAWRAGDHGAGEKLRDLVRERLAGHGIATRDDDVRRSGEIRFQARSEGVIYAVPESMFHPGANGLHDWYGGISLRKEDIADSLPIAFRAIADPRTFQAQPRQVQQDVMDVLRTLFHEELHGASSGDREAYRGSGVGIEEAATEILARKVVREMCGYTEASGVDLPLSLPYKHATGNYVERQFAGSYGRFLRRMFEAVDGVTGDVDIYARVERALLKTRQYHRDRWATGGQQISAFVDAMGLTGTAKARLEALLERDMR